MMSAGKCAIVVLFWTICLYGQADPNAIESASLTLFPPPNFYLDVHFTNALANPTAELVASNITITTSPSPLSPALVIASVQALPGSRRAARITFSSGLPTIASAQVCFHTITFIEQAKTKETVSNVCGAAQLVDPRTAAALKEQLLQELQKVPKTSDEKNVFASGFVTTTSAGSQGGVDLNLNSNDLGIPGMTALLRLKKATAPGGDPKNFEVGAKYRSVYSFAKKDLEQMYADIQALRSAADPDGSARASADLNARQRNIQRHLLGALLFDFGGKLEGGATDFNVANYVADGQIQLQSRTKTLFGSRRGFWRFRVLPVGIEAGKNIQNQTGMNTSTSVHNDSVARYKGGGVLTLFYDNIESQLPIKRMELNGTVVQRFLFLKEAETLAPNTTPVMRDGNRPWYEASVGVFLAESPSGHYGVRLSYNSGSLPPEFAHTRSFQFGFVYETADGDPRQ